MSVIVFYKTSFFVIVKPFLQVFFSSLVQNGQQTTATEQRQNDEKQTGFFRQKTYYAKCIVKKRLVWYNDS